MFSLLRCHEEAVHTVAFTPDSQVLLTACTLGNIRLNYINIENENLITIHGMLSYKVFIFNHLYFLIKICPALEASCSIDGAHDLGVLSADFVKFIHIDRKF